MLAWLVAPLLLVGFSEHILSCIRPLSLACPGTDYHYSFSLRMGSGPTLLVPVAYNYASYVRAAALSSFSEAM